MINFGPMFCEIHTFKHLLLPVSAKYVDYNIP